MRSGAERFLNELFEELIIIDEKEPLLHDKKVRVIITPEIIDAQLKAAGGALGLKRYCQVTCKWTIVTLDGKILYVNTFRGEDDRGVANTLSGKRRCEECMVIAVQDQYRKFISHISSVRWWESIAENFLSPDQPGKSKIRLLPGGASLEGRPPIEGPKRDL